MTTHDDRTGTNPDDRSDNEAIDTEAMGRLLLERQSPAERDQARDIFRQLLAGSSIGHLRKQISDLAELITQASNRRRRGTR